MLSHVFMRGLFGVCSPPVTCACKESINAHMCTKAEPFRSPHRRRACILQPLNGLRQPGTRSEVASRSVLVVDVMLLAPWHTFQALTKRADRMQTLLRGELYDAARAPHIWWGSASKTGAHVDSTQSPLHFTSPGGAFARLQTGERPPR